jgi:hypothetical protein
MPGHQFLLLAKRTAIVAQMAVPIKQLKNTSIDERLHVAIKSGDVANIIAASAPARVFEVTRAAQNVESTSTVDKIADQIRPANSFTPKT